MHFVGDRTDKSKVFLECRSGCVCVIQMGGGGCHAVGEVDAPVWIQNGSTRGLACNGVVKDWGKILSMLEGCV